MTTATSNTAVIVFPGYRDCKATTSGLYAQLYTAIRESDNVPVVLKAPKSTPPTDEEKEALRHELSIMALLKESPSIPRFYSEHTAEKSFFFAMEKIESPTISALLLEKKEFALEEFFSFALAMVTALENIHRYDVIHKDINEYNILYDEKKAECKIVDFGLSIAINHQRVIPVNPAFLEGTLLYLSSLR